MLIWSQHECCLINAFTCSCISFLFAPSNPPTTNSNVTTSTRFSPYGYNSCRKFSIHFFHASQIFISVPFWRKRKKDRTAETLYGIGNVTKCPVCVCTYVRATVNMSLNFTLWNKNPIYSNNVSVKVPRIESTLYSIARKKNRSPNSQSLVRSMSRARQFFSHSLYLYVWIFFNIEWNQFNLSNGFFGQCCKCSEMWFTNQWFPLWLDHGIACFSFLFSIDKNHFTLNFTWNSWKSSNYILQWLLTEWNIVLLLFSTMTQQTFSQLFD